MDGLVELLFKYRPLVFQQGEVTLAAPGSVRAAAVAAALAGLAVAATYALAKGRAGAVDRTVMAVLRLGLLALLLFCLLRPTLVLSTVVPQQNFVGVLIDDSRSMTLAGGDGAPRSAFVEEAFAPDGGELLDALAERFTLRFYRFASDASRIDGPGELSFRGSHTNLGAALDAAREELSGVPLSGLVVLSDGADNSGRAITESLVPLQAAGVPVFTVGLGDEVVSPDIEVGQVELPRTILAGSSLVVDVVVTQSGMGRVTVPLIVEDDRRLLADEEVTLGPDGEPVVVRVAFQLDDEGPRRVRFRIPPQPGERVEENNAHDVWLEVRGAREKILYFEGEPRFEVKFIRRAVADDDNLQVVVLQRTAESKFLRLDVDDAQELVAGFPRTREELYRYKGLVLGSVEASFFTHDQLQMIADFVSERGGGLLALGGRSSFAEGGWKGTPVEEALPLVLPDDPAPDELTELAVRATPAGRAHPALQLRPGSPGDTVPPASSDEAGDVWERLPPLTTVNVLTRLRPGATALLTAPDPQGGPERVVLAHQRYGRGRALVFGVQDSWLWQMHADVPLDDTTHETLWQQLLRWLVDGVPDPVLAALEREQAEPGEAVRLVATVADSTYIEVNDAVVRATVTTPTGAERTVELPWTVDRDGEYAAEIVPDEPGDYAIEVVATSPDGSVLGRDETYLHAAPGHAEFFGAGMRSGTLRRIAEETGGRFYTPATASTLADDIAVTGAGVTLTEERDLWDMPVLFLLALALMSAEWGYRRARALV